MYPCPYVLIITDKAFFPRFGRREYNTVLSFCPSGGTEGQYVLDVAVAVYPQPGKMNKVRLYIVSILLTS